MINWFTRKPIHDQIDEYVALVSERIPWRAGAYRSILKRLALNSGVSATHLLTVEMIAFFVGEELTPYFRSEALKAIRGYIKYARMVGYSEVSPYDLMENTLGRPRNIRKIKEVQLLKSRGMSYREIRKALVGKHKKKVHLSSIFRWANYPS